MVPALKRERDGGTTLTDSFRQHLRRQLTFLEHSCRSYDGGYLDEAIRMAVVLRVLFHDTKNSTSLLRHLHAWATPIVSTCAPAPAQGAAYFEGMAMLRVGARRMQYYAPLATSFFRRMLLAPEWWWEIVSIQQPGLLIRRRDVVLGAANKEGAHIDPELTREYGALSAEGALGDRVWSERGEERRQPIGGAHLIYIRQMAYEVMASPALLQLGSM
jgi:hypothetical protein